jgi:hypothetical protein
MEWRLTRFITGARDSTGRPVMNKSILAFVAVFLFWTPPVLAQNQPSTPPQRRGVDNLLNYLNMAGTETAANFRPLTQKERRDLYLKGLVNPFLYVKAGFSSGLDQWNDKPHEWEQGASGYGKRFANILGQYATQRTVTWGLSSALHEDNRYFNSGKKGFWPRTNYALWSGILARTDSGKRRFSFSQVGGTAAGAFLANTWLPPSQNSAGSGAVSFGISMGVNIGFSVVKEFLPDVAKAIQRKRNKPKTPPPAKPPSTAESR